MRRAPIFLSCALAFLLVAPIAQALTLTQDHRLYDTGPEVLQIQQFLNTQGYPVASVGPGSPGQETNFFGSLTFAALKKFQAATGLPSTGFFGPMTRGVAAAYSDAASASPAVQAPSVPLNYVQTDQGPVAIKYSSGHKSHDTTAPTVSLDTPPNGAAISGLSNTISATASDDTGVAGVTFKADGADIGPEDTSSPYSISWDSTGVADGSHTLVAVARDASGNLASSAPITVTTSNSAGTAEMYWVGGSGNWSDPHHWATSSGGIGQYFPPTASNIVHFDSSSSAGSYTVTIDTAASTATTTVANPAGGSPAFAGSAAWANSGGLTLVSGMGWTYTGAMTFNAASLGKTITTAGVTLANNITFNGTGGGWTLQDNLTTGTANTVKLTAGAWNTNAKTITAGIVDIGGTATRTFTATNSTINLSGHDVSAWNVVGTTGLTRTFTGSTINMLGVNATFTGASINNYGTVNFNGGGLMVIAGANAYANLTVNAPGIIGYTPDILTIPSSALQSILAGGRLTLAGFSQTRRLLVQSSSAGFNATLNGLSGSTQALSNVDFTNITGAGTMSPLSGTSVGDAGGNSSVTATTPTTRYWVGNAGEWIDKSHWAASSGGSGGADMPLPQDTAIFDDNSFTADNQVVIANMNRVGNVDFSPVTAHFPTLDILGTLDQTQVDQYVTVYGNLTLNAGMRVIGGDDFGSTWDWRNQTGTKTLTTSGVVWPGAISMNGPGGTLSLADDLNTKWLVLTKGTLNANNHNVTVSFNFTSGGATARTLTMGSGTWNFTYTPTGGTAVIWGLSGSNLTLNANTSTIVFHSSAPSLGAREFFGAGKTYNNFVWADEGGGQNLIILGANTFNNFTVAASSARSLTLPASVTNTATAFSLSGTAGNNLSVLSSIPGTKATMSQAAGTVAGDRLLIQDSAATGGATFNAANSVDAGNNSGWNFQ